MRNAEQHGREKHQITHMDDATRNKVRSNIRRAA
jgi:predicted small metal-binding protein